MQYYLKMKYGDDTIRLNLIPNGVDLPDNNILRLSFYSSSIDFVVIKSIFSDIDSITVYGCIVQEDGRETDEYVSMYYDKYTYLKKIDYDFDEDVYTVELLIPDETEKRLETLEKKAEEPIPLVSAFTSNREPTGIASRYYAADELIAIYDKNGYPITVKVTLPIGYNSSIIEGLNCEEYHQTREDIGE